MNGANHSDARYIAARRVLLDALEALGDHRRAVILVGAQAVYLHAGELDEIAVAPYTEDPDLAVDPMTLAPDPRLLAQAVAGIADEDVLDASGVALVAEPKGVHQDS